MQEFYINKDATLPLLKMELINDGRNDFGKFYEYIQDAIITFSMVNADNGVIKVANNSAFLAPVENVCNEEYFICYQWDPRDTKTKGKYFGKFTITFGDLYGGGKLIVPIQEELVVYIQ